MRKIILQDAVMFRFEHPNSVLFTNAVFRDPEFPAFEELLLRVCRTAQPPADMQLQQAMPLVSQQLQTVAADVNSNSAVLQAFVQGQPTSQDAASGSEIHG
jgi:hypothetical protein